MIPTNSSPDEHSTLLSNAETVDAEIARIEKLPREVGVLLMVAGVGGMLLPGPVGSPFLLLGGVVLWPRAFRGIDQWFGRRYPRLHRESMRQIVRFLNDLERRYPTER